MKINEQLYAAIDYLDQGLSLRAERVEALAATPGKIGEAIEQWVASRDLIARVKALKAKADALNDVLTDRLIPAQIDWFNAANSLREEAPVPHALGRVEIRRHVKASILPAYREQAYAWLQGNDLGGIIIQTVNAQTLGATAKDLLAQGKDLPADLFSVSTRRYAAFVEEKASNANQKEPSRRAAAARAGGEKSVRRSRQ